MGKKTFLTILALSSLCLFSNCAVEESQEQRTRDDLNRQLARLARPVGTYSGVLLRPNNQKVPVSLDITIQNNPTKGVDDPALLGSLRIGLFGGVQIASTSSSFIWNNGKFSFTFSRTVGTAGKAMEIRGVATDHGIEQVVLDTPRQGLFPLDIQKDGPSLFSSDSVMRFAWTTPGAENAGGSKPPQDAQLTINLKNESMAAPANLDLPFLPGLNATMEFTPLGQSPQSATSVIYDPIGGTLELYFSKVSHLWFEGLALNPPDAKRTSFIPNKIDGIALIGSVQKASISASRLPSKQSLEIDSLPWLMYRGSYKASGPELRAEVTINYQGVEGTNTMQFPFPAFPKLRMEMLLCNGEETHDRKILNLIGVDNLNSRLFWQLDGSSNPNDLEMTFTPGWQQLEGDFLKGSGIGTPRPHVVLSPRDFQVDYCAEPPGVS